MLMQIIHVPFKIKTNMKFNIPNDEIKDILEMHSKMKKNSSVISEQTTVNTASAEDPNLTKLRDAIKAGCLINGALKRSKSTNQVFYRKPSVQNPSLQVDFFGDMTYKFVDGSKSGKWKCDEIATNATSLPTAVYTHPDTDVVFTGITSSGAAIYTSSYSGIQSTIAKFTLATNGTMPTLTSAITAAEMPSGERIYKIAYYLGFMLIGTTKGIRAAVVSDDGSLAYGPLIWENSQPVYDFCFRDRFTRLCKSYRLYSRKKS